jgi:hypothetical protein
LGYGQARSETLLFDSNHVLSFQLSSGFLNI